MKKNIIFLIPFTFKLVKKKGIIDLFNEYKCNGYFDKVIIWGFNCDQSSRIRIDDVTEIVETKPKFNNKILDFFYYIIVGFFLIKNEKINLIRANEASIRGFIGLILSKILKIPFCVSAHADYDKYYELGGRNISPVICGSRKISIMFETFVIRRADLLMPIREILKKKMLEKGAKEEKIKVIPHGIDLNAFIESGKNIDVFDLFKISHSKNILSFAARFSKENYVYELLELAKIFKNNNIKNIIIVAAGGGYEYKNVKNEIDKYNLNEYIMVVGNQNRNVISALRQSSSVNLCLMSGFSLIEACAGARPTISFDVDWHYELVKNNETGFLVQEKNMDELFEKIMFLVNNPEKAEIMGKNAKNLVFQKHSLEESIKTKIECYERLYNMKKYD